MSTAKALKEKVNHISVDKMSLNVIFESIVRGEKKNG